ncbi:hypothetical protein NPIL_412781 [Nephila pilipes]|uniref:Uncharacterized protein n=1 Tax=Nephila pilipes TaxID=299642 RepID=A0A8X6N5Y1_NEPPI|nr:hypothetical protein NPIL_412781 [Nephila pilipes]
MDSESLLDQDMISSASSSRASTPTHHEDFHVSCKRKREIERELKTYTDSIDHCQVLIRNLERQGLASKINRHHLQFSAVLEPRYLLTEVMMITAFCYWVEREWSSTTLSISGILFCNHGTGFLGGQYM